MLLCGVPVVDRDNQLLPAFEVEGEVTEALWCTYIHSSVDTAAVSCVRRGADAMLLAVHV